MCLKPECSVKVVFEQLKLLQKRGMNIRKIKDVNETKHKNVQPLKSRMKTECEGKTHKNQVLFLVKQFYTNTTENITVEMLTNE